MAHTKSGGSTSLGRDSQSQRLGVKLNHGQRARAGMVIIRQRGTKYHPGDNVRRGNDDTLYAAVDGTIRFSSKKRRGFDGAFRVATVVSCMPAKSR